MLKLRKPFFSKMQLHIRQELLQQLWDKYIPVSAADYGRIQLVYLNQDNRQKEPQTKKLQLQIRLMLNNSRMRMGLGEIPSAWVPGQKQINNSLRRMEKYYLTQLRSCDFVMFRTMSTYLKLQEQAAEDRKRYQIFQREHQMIEKQRQEYQQISEFFMKVKEFMTNQSVQTARRLEQELIGGLTETEYQTLTKNFRNDLSVSMGNVDKQTIIWEKHRNEMLEKISRMEPVEIQQIWKQIQSKNQREQVSEQWGTDGFSKRFIAIQEKFDREIIQEFEEHVSSLLRQEQFRAIPDVVDVSWEELVKAPERRIVSQIEQVLETKKTQIEQREKQALEIYQEMYDKVPEFRNFVVQQAKNQAQYVEETFRIRHEEKVSAEEIRRIQEWGQVFFENFYLTPGQSDIKETSAKEENFQNQTQEKKSLLKIQREESEVSSVLENLYSVQFKGVEELVHLIQEINLYLREKTAYDKTIVLTSLENAIQETKVQNFLTSMHGWKAVQSADDIRYLAETLLLWHRRDTSEVSESTIQGNEIETTKEMIRNRYQDKLPEKEIQTIFACSKQLAEITEEKPFVYSKEQTELIHLLEEINHRMETQSKGKNIFLIYQESYLKEPKVQKLLVYMRGLEEVQREKYVCCLAELLLIWQQVFQDGRLLEAKKILRVEEEEVIELSEQAEWQEDFSSEVQEERLASSKNILQREALKLLESAPQRENLKSERKAVQSDDREFPDSKFQNNDMQASDQPIQSSDLHLRNNTVKSEKSEILRGELRNDNTKLPMRHVQGNDLKLFVSKLQEIEQEIQNRYSQGRRMETTDDKTQKQEPEIESRDKVEKRQEREQERIVGEYQGTTLEHLIQEEQRREQGLTERIIQREQRDHVLNILSQEQQDQVLDILSQEQRREQGTTEHITQKEEPEAPGSEADFIQVIDLDSSENRFHENGFSFSDSKMQNNNMKFLEAFFDENDMEMDALERVFLDYYGEELSVEEVQTVREWSSVFAEFYFVRQGQRKRNENNFASVHSVQELSVPNGSNGALNSELLIEFAKEHSPNSDAEMQRIQEWSSVFAESDGTKQQQKELIHLIQEINYDMETQNLFGEDVTLIWQEDGLKSQKIKELLVHVHKLKREERTEFIHKLAEMILLWQESYSFRKQLEGTSMEQLSQFKELESADKILQKEAQISEELYRKQVIESTLNFYPSNHSLLQEEWLSQISQLHSAEISNEMLEEWTQALMLYPKQEQIWEDGDILAGNQEDISFPENLDKEDIQTRIIHRQIESAKDRNNLQKLIMRINHKIHSKQKTGQQEQSKTQELIYYDNQLGQPQIQSLLRHIRNLDEQQYGALINVLSNLIGRKREISSVQSIQEVLEESGQDIRSFAENSRITKGEPPENSVWMVYRQGTKNVGAFYQTLSYRIQSYEKRRHRTMRENVRKFELAYNFQDGYQSIQPNEENGAAKTVINRENKVFILEQGGRLERLTDRELPSQLKKSYQDLELQYSVQQARTSQEEQRAELQMREEAIQMKSVQEQLSRKLKELEEQLKEVEGEAKAQEDVRALAEQVKKQLYEELHVEKLRRGLL